MNIETKISTEPRNIDDGDLRPPSFMQQFDVLEFGRILWRRKSTVFSVALAIMIFGIVIVFALTPRYTATTYIEINPRQTRVVDFEAVLSGLPADVATLETEMQILRSRSLAKKVIDKLRLDRRPEFNTALRAPDTFSAILLSASAASTAASQGDVQGRTAANANDLNNNTNGYWVERTLSSLIRRFQNLLTPKLDEPRAERASLERRTKQELTGIVDRFLSRLTVQPVGRSRVIAISFQSRDPEIAAAAANTLGDFYIVSQLEAKYDAAKRANAWLNERIAVLRDEVGAAESAVEQFREKSNLLQGGSNVPLADEQISELNTQYVTERTRYAEAEARLRQAEKLLASPDAIETADEVLNSQTIRDLRRQETEVERKVADLATEYGERHPRMINARAELQDVRNKIAHEIRKIIQSLRNEVGVAKARTDEVKAALNDMKREVATLNESEVQLRALEREASASRSLLEQLLTRSKETASQADFQQPDANVITAAVTPSIPSYPRKSLFLAVIFLVASVSGMTAAFTTELLERGLRSAEQIEAKFGIPGIGLIPSLGRMKSVTTSPADYALDNPLSAYAEAVRSVYNNLLLVKPSEEFKTIMVASALPNEGKSSLITSMARVLSKQNLKVIVLDCDLRRPSLHKAFKQAADPGLVDYLMGKADLESVIVKDPASSAHFICAGHTSGIPSTLLSSELLQRLLKSLSRRYDLVLIDSSPVLAVPDGLFLGRLADRVILVIRWAHTPRKSIELAVKRLREARCNVAGAVLSIVDIKGHARYGYADSGAYHGELRRYYSG